MTEQTPDTTASLPIVGAIEDVGANRIVHSTSVAEEMSRAIGLPDLPSPEGRQTELGMLTWLAQRGAEALKTSLSVHEITAGHGANAGYFMRVGSGIDEEHVTHIMDFDDTAIATSQAKERVADGYKAYLKDKLGLHIDEATVDDILRTVDQDFSRWDEGGGVVHHFDAHYLGLSWAAQFLRRNTTASTGTVAAEDVNSLLETLKNFTSERSHTLPLEPPFTWEGTTLNSHDPSLIDGDITAVMLPIIRIEPFVSTIDAYRQLQYEGANTGILSLGVPQQQLFKVLARLIADKGQHGAQSWLPEIIMLTKVEKGAFLKALDHTAASNTDVKTFVSYAKAQHEGRQALTILDDDNGQLESIHTAADALGMQVATVLSRRPDTKNAMKIRDLPQDPQTWRARIAAFPDRAEQPDAESRDTQRLVAVLGSCALSEK